jgi:hypothetical protein
MADIQKPGYLRLIGGLYYKRYDTYATYKGTTVAACFDALEMRSPDGRLKHMHEIELEFVPNHSQIPYMGKISPEEILRLNPGFGEIVQRLKNQYGLTIQPRTKAQIVTDFVLQNAPPDRSGNIGILWSNASKRIGTPWTQDLADSQAFLLRPHFHNTSPLLVL